MAIHQPEPTSDRADPNWFATTHWSVVLAAGQKSSPQTVEALEKLCRTYWYPLYVYIRRLGHDPADAEDLTQEFLTGFLERNSLDTVDPAKGKFRSFLLASLHHFLANHWDKARAEKRGGRQTFISLDEENAEDRYRLEPVSALSPERIFERRWALTLLDRALTRLREEFISAGKADQFGLLKVFLEGETAPGDYAGLASKLGMSAGAAAVAVHRLRQRYREFVRMEVAQTVASPFDIDGEMRHLFRAIWD